MAVEFSVDHSRTSEYLILPEDITVRPELNGREETPDLTWLRASIRAFGQQIPITIRNEAGQPILEEGHNRWIVVTEWNEERRKEGLPPVKLRCAYSKCNEQQGFVHNWVSNHHRNECTMMDDAHCFAQMTKWGMPPEEMAKQLNAGLPEDTPGAVTVKHINACLALYAATPELQQAVVERRVKPTAAAKLAKMTNAQQRKAVQGEGRVTGKVIEAAVSRPAEPSLLPQAKSKPSPKQIREAIEERRDDTTEEPLIREFCAQVCFFMDGEAETIDLAKVKEEEAG